MAETRRTSAALATQDVWTILVAGTWIAGEHVTLTVGVRDIRVTVGSTVTVAAIAAAIKECWNGDTITGNATRSDTGDNVPEFAEATAAVGTDTVTVTMTTAGVPLGLSAATDSGSGTLTVTNTQAAAGPEFWGGVDNWSNGVPVDADTVYLDGSAGNIRHGLDQSAIQPAALHVALSFTGEIGLPEQNPNGYREYRTQYLKIGPVALKIGAGAGTGSGRVKIDTGTDPCALTVFASGSALEANLPAVIWKGTSASNALVQTGGSLGVAVFGGETATLATINKSGGDLVCGAGVTLSGALTQAGGTAVLNSAVATSWTQTGGATAINGTGAVALAKVQGGTLAYNTTGTLGGASLVSGDGVLDFSGNSIATTVTSPLDLYGTACRVLDPNKRLGAIVLDLNQGAVLGQLDLGLDFRITRGATA